MAKPKPAPKSDLLQGTLDLLILRTLSLGPMHGWGISQRIQQISRDVLQVNQGSLYPALARLEVAGRVDARWGVSENNRQAKFYALTKAGERQLEVETANWERLSAAVARVLRLAGQEAIP
ncbi:MAG TPA: PadR family transcriptional regulator [Thermoanaerobaculia bacterium]|nr:PadR family transcriptional regulator [Thermoanaerobaculia bacterium]